MENYSLIFKLHINTDILSTRFKVSDYLQSVLTKVIITITTITREQKQRKTRNVVPIHPLVHTQARADQQSVSAAGGPHLTAMFYY